MYRSTFGRGWKDIILLPQQKKSYGVTVDFSRFTDNCTKITNAKISSNYMFCKGTKMYSIQKVSNEKKAKFFAFEISSLHRKRTKSNCLF